MLSSTFMRVYETRSKKMYAWKLDDTVESKAAIIGHAERLCQHPSADTHISAGSWIWTRLLFPQSWIFGSLFLSWTSVVIVWPPWSVIVRGACISVALVVIDLPVVDRRTPSAVSAGSQTLRAGPGLFVPEVFGSGSASLVRLPGRSGKHLSKAALPESGRLPGCEGRPLTWQRCVLSRAATE